MCESWVNGTWKPPQPGRNSEGAYKIQKGGGRGLQAHHKSHAPASFLFVLACCLARPLLLACGCVMCGWAWVGLLRWRRVRSDDEEGRRSRRDGA